MQGQVFLNGFNVGRYWPSAGPQVTLYVPKGAIRASPEPNILVMMELESAPCGSKNQSCSVHFTDQPILNARCYEDSMQQLPSYKAIPLHRGSLE